MCTSSLQQIRSARTDPQRCEDAALSVEIIQRANGRWDRDACWISDLPEIHASSEIIIVFITAGAHQLSAEAFALLSDIFKVPAIFWSKLAQDATGFFGCKDHHRVSGGHDGHSSFFRFLVKEVLEHKSIDSKDADNYEIPYTWHKLGFCTNWDGASATAALCFDLPDPVKESMIESFEATGAEIPLNHPYALHSIILECAVARFDVALWGFRDLVREIEKSRISTHPEPDYIKMHEIARHTLHSSETLEMAIEVVANIIQEHEIFSEQSSSSKDIHKDNTPNQIRKSLKLQSTLLKCLHLRSIAVDKRLHNEINLAFNMVAQYDSRIQLRIGEATQSDNTAVKMISFLGFFFLPGTFVSAVFGMSFFNFAPGSETVPQRWTMSNKFWLYWAITIPITAVVMALGLAWLRVFARNSFTASLR